MKSKLKILMWGFVAVFFLALLFFLSGGDMALLNPKGAIGIAERNLLITATGLMLIVVIPVFVMLFGFAWRYREGNKKARYTPEWNNSLALEITWWIIPFIIVFILSVIAWKTTHELDPFNPIESNQKTLVIQAVALNWKWLFIYPEQGIATVNVVDIPVGVPVRFDVTSDGPMNSLWIPRLGTQVYAMAAMRMQLHLIANEAGNYEGMSSNFSGDGFEGMHFPVEARSQEEFNKWVIRVKQSTKSLTLDEYNRLAAPSENDPQTFYATVKSGLFDYIMQVYMMPGMYSPGMTAPSEMPHAADQDSAPAENAMGMNMGAIMN